MQFDGNDIPVRLEQVQRHCEAANERRVDRGTGDGAKDDVARRHGEATDLRAVHVEYRAVVDDVTDFNTRDVDPVRQVEGRPEISRDASVDAREQCADGLDWHIAVLETDESLAREPAGVVQSGFPPCCPEIRAGRLVFPGVVQRENVHQQRTHRYGCDRISRARRRHVEIRNARPAIRRPALRYACELQAVDHAVNHRSIACNQSNLPDLARQREIKMVWSTTLVAVRHEWAIPVAVHKTQWRNLVEERLADGLVRHPQAAEIHGQRIRVVELDEVFKESAAGSGEPFVDAQRSLRPGGRGNIGRAEGRHAQAPLPIRLAADGKIRELPAELHRVDHTRAIRRAVHEVNIVSVAIDAKADVQAARGVLVVREQHAIRSSRQRGASRDGVFVRVIKVVRQAQPGEIDGRRAAVVELDVIGSGAFVVRGAFVARQHFVDDHATQAGENGPRLRYRRVRIRLPGACAVPADDVHRVVPVRQAAQTDRLTDETIRAPCAAVHAIAILRDVRTTDVQRRAVHIGR